MACDNIGLTMLGHARDRCLQRTTALRFVLRSARDMSILLNP